MRVRPTIVILALLGTGLSASLGLSQTPSPAPAETLVQRVARGDRGAIPELRARFAAAGSKVEKRDAAFNLVRLGDPDPVPWTYLAGEATIAVEKDAPYPNEIGPDGRVVRGKLSADFVRWATERGMSARQAAEDAIYSDPADVLVLARTVDPRATPILLRALRARNLMLVVVGALGLGRLHARPAIPEILAAARRAPVEFGPVIARGLLFFDDAETRRTAEAIVGRAEAERFLETLRERGPDAVY